MSTDCDVVVIGAGFSGIYAVHVLRDELGLRVNGFDAADGPGGTWYWNRYPGARCDIDSVHYSYSFSDEIQRNWHWSEKFAGQPEILAYLEYCADTLDVRRDFLFGVRVTEVRWDERQQVWHTTVADGRQFTSTFVVAATGNLSIPQPPDIAGLADFEGGLYSTSRWPHEGVELAGKRIGVIGTGSTGIQVISAVAPEAARLTVFQRTPSYAFPMRNELVDPQQRRRLAEHHDTVRAGSRQHPAGVTYELPHPSSLAASAAERRERYEQMWRLGGLRPLISAYGDVLIDEHANELLAEFVREKIHERVRDEKTAALLAPRYPLGSRRAALETDYYDVFNRDNVELVDLRTDPIRTVTRTGIETTEGSYDLDVIILATGFDAITGPLLNLGLTGRDGRTLRDHWASGPRTFLGMAIHGFPNLFTITGPQSAAAFYNNPIAIEDHVRYVRRAIEHVLESGNRTIEATAEAEARWVELTTGLLDVTVVPKADSWYMGSNVAGKPRGTFVFAGGGHLFNALAASVETAGYGGFRTDSPANPLPWMLRLDGAVAGLVGELILREAKPLAECSVAELRQTFAGFAALQGPPRDVVVVDAAYRSAGHDLPVRIYLPRTAGPLPVFVYYHGGGFVGGSIESNDSLCRALAEDLRMAVVAPSYRLAPEHPFPAAPDDAFAALAWVEQRIAEYGGDPTRIVVAGESAGASLAAVTALRARDERGPALTAQVLVSPVTDVHAATASRAEFVDGPLLTTAAVERMLAHYLPDPAAATSPWASPLRAASLAKLPPALVLTAEIDPLRDEGEDYGSALALAGVPTVVRRLRGLVHGGFGMAGVVPRTGEYTAAIIDHLTPLLAADSVPARR